MYNLTGGITDLGEPTCMDRLEVQYKRNICVFLSQKSEGVHKKYTSTSHSGTDPTI